jgi:Zn-dependent protease with chaperone function
MKFNEMFKPSLLLFSLFLSGVLSAQPTKHQLMVSKGTIPDHFLERSVNKYKAQVSEISNNEDRFEKKIQKRFYLESNYLGSQLLMSGKVLVNDTIGAYLNQIADVLLADNPDLRSKVNFYVVKSPIINAFATDQGNIFINMGLIAKVKNEAQLAYIMCHEIIHFVRKHSIQRYVEAEKIDASKGVYTQGSLDDKIFLKSFYAKSQETEADSLGFVLFSKTAFRQQNAVDALALLTTFDLPFDQQATDYTAFFSSPLFSLDSLSVMPLDSFSRKVNKESDYKTHPEIEDRVAKINKLISPSDSSRKNFLVSTDLFNVHRLSARFEIAHYFLRKHEFYHALYCAYNLSVEYPDNPFLRDILVKSFYGISRVATLSTNFGTLKSDWYRYAQRVRDNMKYEAPEIQQLYHFFGQIKKGHLNYYGISKLWHEYHLTESEVAKIRLTDLVADYKTHYQNNKDSFFHRQVEDLMHVSSFNTLYAAAEDKTPIEEPAKKRLFAKRDRPKIKHLIALDPNYLKFDLRKEHQIKYIASERSLNEYHNGLDQVSEKLGVKIDVLSPSRFTAIEVQKFNDMALFNTYFEEQSYAFSKYGADYEAIHEVCDRYGTDKVALLGTLSFHLDKNKSKSTFFLLWTAVVFPLFPLGVYNYSIPLHRTFNYAFVFDLEKQSLVFSNVHRTTLNDLSSTVKSALYYNLHQISK